MKNDPTFKVLALAIIAGVIVSFVSPAHDAAAPSAATTTAAQTQVESAVAATE